MLFSKAAVIESWHTYTENGAKAMSTTGNPVLDLFGTIGSLRDADFNRVVTLFSEAYNKDPLLATKCMFYARDIRGGLGERTTFRFLVYYCAKKHPEALKENIPLIPFFGRFDDLYALVDTPLEDMMWSYMKDVLELDLMAMRDGKPCSLLGKWICTPSRTNKEARKLGLKSVEKLGYRKISDFRKDISALRRYLKVVEVKMCSGEWNEIDYEQVPSRAMLIYRRAFFKHDMERFGGYIESLKKGEAKVNSGTLYPYDLIGKYMSSDCMYRCVTAEDPIVEEQWKALPNYVEAGTNAIVMADTSGSMTCDNNRPINAAVGLAIYFAERNKGAYHNLWMSFSSRPRFHVLRGESLLSKLLNMDMRDWGANTNLESAFMQILHVAINNNVSPREMPKALIVISDMEIDQCTMVGWSFYDEMKRRFAAAGYLIPGVIFWNVNSRSDIFHVDAKRKGVLLVSGSSTSTFKNLLASIDSTPEALMLKILNDKRYDVITIAKDYKERQ